MINLRQTEFVFSFIWTKINQLQNVVLDFFFFFKLEASTYLKMYKRTTKKEPSLVHIS